MSRKVSTAQGRKSRRNITLLWVAVLVGVTITLLALEQTALLYVLATVGLTVLLVIVAMADLSGAHKTLNEPAPADDAAAIGTGISSTMPQQSAPARPAPRARKRT
jgi:peptidoglycan/LPS O-acetylase OafA/YrhL